MSSLFFSSGLFLGWSLGANNMSNVFGTAVGTRMIRFRTAAVWCSVFVILGSVISGAGATETLGRLGSVNALAGAFMVAFASALTMLLMTKASYPASTSQTIIGSIVGWDLFSGSLIDYGALTKILSTWIVCPILAALFSMLLYRLCRRCLLWSKPHMLTQDALTRFGLLLAGIFGAYALGANNISTVMGVFVPISDFADIHVFGLFTLSAAQQLFLLGGLAIAVGVFTYSKRVIMTVGGGGIMPLSPVAAFVVVVSHSLVLTIFSSQGLVDALVSLGLPPIPLVPVSSSQAIVGAVLGIGLLKGGRSIRWRTVGAICSSWVVTPFLAAALCYVSLFFLQNVFMQQTYRPVRYALTGEALACSGVALPREKFEDVLDTVYPNAVRFHKALDSVEGLTAPDREALMRCAERDEVCVTREAVRLLRSRMVLDAGELQVLQGMVGKKYSHEWQIREVLLRGMPGWMETAQQPATRSKLDAVLRAARE